MVHQGLRGKGQEDVGINDGVGVDGDGNGYGDDEENVAESVSPGEERTRQLPPEMTAENLLKKASRERNAHSPSSLFFFFSAYASSICTSSSACTASTCSTHQHRDQMSLIPLLNISVALVGGTSFHRKSGVFSYQYFPAPARSLSMDSNTYLLR